MKGIAHLCQHISTATLDQLCAVDEMTPKAWLKEFGRFVETKKIPIKQPAIPAKPVLDWEPGDKEPDFEAISYHLMTRFKGVPTYQATFVAALPQARHLFGGRCRGLPKRTAAFHDALLAAFFFSRDERTRLHLWVPERKLYRWRRKPDALILDERGKGLGTIIDIGGRYNVAHLKSGFGAWKYQRFQIW